MTDFGDSITRVLQDSDIVRIRPNILVQIYTAGTSTLIWEGSADANGVFSVPTLATGQYDIKVDGKIVRTIHHVKADHSHKAVEIFEFFKSGSIAGDSDEVNTMQIYGTDVAGTIEKISILVQSVDVTADMRVHLLKGAAGGGAALTMASNSAWNYRVNPGSAQNRFKHDDASPGISLAVDDCITIGIDYTAGTISGLTVKVIFRPD